MTPAASAFAAAEAFADIASTVESAGLHALAYHADVPTLGLTSFIVASKETLPSRIGTDGLALDLGRDLRRKPGQPATLYDQRVVTAFRDELERRGR